MVWVHLRKDRFPLLPKSKLKPRGAGPYKVLAKINDNAYSVDIPIEKFGGVSNSFKLKSLVELATASTLLICHHMLENTLERRGRRLLKGGR